MVVTNEMIEAFIEDVKDGYADVCGVGDDEFFIDGIVNVREALTAALAVAPGVEVKPLEWVENLGLWTAQTNLIAFYSVWDCGDHWECSLLDGKFPSAEAAKSAAQADYTARIMSALATTETNGHPFTDGDNK